MDDIIQTLEEPGIKAVPNLPFWLSAANTEFSGNRWASNILSLAGTPAPRWLSTLAGKSAGTHKITVGNSNNYRYGFSKNDIGAISPNSFESLEITGIDYTPSSNFWDVRIGSFGNTFDIRIEGGGYYGEFIIGDGRGEFWRGDSVGLGNYLVSNSGKTVSLNLIRT